MGVVLQGIRTSNIAQSSTGISLTQTSAHTARQSHCLKFQLDVLQIVTPPPPPPLLLPKHAKKYFKLAGFCLPAEKKSQGFIYSRGLRTPPPQKKKKKRQPGGNESGKASSNPYSILWRHGAPLQDRGA